MSRYLFTSESVSEGHPDKVCDQISDAVLDLMLDKDPYARVAVEAMATTDRVVLAGETRVQATVSPDEIEQTVRRVIQNIGYEQPGFNSRTVQIENYLHTQSADIALGVDRDGAGDQGIMFGYATNECPDTHFMPAPIFYAHLLLKNLAHKRHIGLLKGLGPDAKSQITFLYENDKPVAVDNMVVSTQHTADTPVETVREMVIQTITETIPHSLLCPENKIFINPTGRFVIGGPEGDTGLTGRKIIVDTYGGAAPHGGGAFSGKDATKVDRTAAYMARYIAKNIVAAGLADKCLIQLSYAIGVAHPLSVYVNTSETGKIPDEQLTRLIEKEIDLTPKGMREALNLNKPIFLPTAAYGHFGRTPQPDGTFSWEKTDLTALFQKSI